MSTDDAERIQQQANEPAVVSAAAASPSPPTTEPGPSPSQASVPQARQPADELVRSIDSTPNRPAETGLTSSAADKLRAEFAEISAIAAQAARLGVTVDAADAVRKGVSADALRRSVLDTLAARAEATNVIAAAPSPGPAAVGDSPIVRRAKERAAENRA
jgi:capsid assembly protease